MPHATCPCAISGDAPLPLESMAVIGLGVGVSCNCRMSACEMKVIDSF
ncbi:hypothetical protein MYVA_5471 [Mycolicibacterium vaccae 95051]|nr:hypothetical protein MYVA_5471 [Mycolicibacterium vaccae 95051]